MKARKKIKIFLQGFVLFNVLWYLLAIVVNMRVLPKPTDVYLNMNHLYGEKLHIHVFVSLYRVLGGLAVSLVLGISIGLLMAYSRIGNKLLNPLVYFTYPIPKTALLPVVMLLFGLGDSSKFIVIVLILVFQVIVAVKDAVLNISPETYHPIRSLGASRLQIFTHITLPAILPELLTNLRLSIGTALSILFFAEGYGTQYGIGYYILDAWMRIDYIGMYAGIVVISLLGFTLFILIDLLEEAMCKWKIKLPYSL
ncbi:NitT/TauT family transport system permease protein [Anaerosolibacter carboniphilus]|uniref:NitT/TauT family transport system permease protein n=1 Tax=Anaerosolibacter carboniphilus TaxID=1417629 RepID=A0A841KTI1_9FIRM|nr:ABC transporter permease [Anaerosolibacter carboniphilus]MBB6214232.1 NitT/TauT family transport system permease protein [Anaerosolibacter carboniphilus]